MEWHRYLAACCLLVASSLLSAQEPAPRGDSQATLTVIGDVASPGKFGFQPPMTIRDAVAGAHPLAEAVNVTVLRNGQPGAQWTKLIRLGARDSGEHAAQGDVLVVEALSQLQTGGPRNAAVRTMSGTTVIALEDSGVVVGDVLQGLGIDGGSGVRVAIAARLKGQRSLQQAGNSTLVQHGDVLSVDAPLGFVEAPTPAAAGGAVSEWPSQSSSAGTNSPARYPDVPPVPATMAEPLIKSGADAGPGLVIPTWPRPVVESELPVRREVVSAPPQQRLPELSQEQLPGTRTTVEQVETDLATGGSEEIISLEQQLGIAPVPRELAAVKPKRSRKALPASQTRVVTKLEEPVVESARRSSNLDLLVISGLMIAGVWFFVRAYRASSVSAGVAVESVSGRSANVSEPTAGTAAVVTGGVETASAAAVSYASVSDMTVGPGRAAVRSELEAGWRPSADIAGPAPTPTVNEAVRIYGTPRGSAVANEGAGRAGDLRDRLDHLLRNAVPIDEVSPRLPADLTLYGRAQDPRTYRLDAGHTGMAPPHFERARQRGLENVAESRLSRVLGAEARHGGLQGQGRATGAVTTRNDEGHGT